MALVISNELEKESSIVLILTITTIFKNRKAGKTKFSKLLPQKTQKNWYPTALNITEYVEL